MKCNFPPNILNDITAKLRTISFVLVFTYPISISVEFEWLWWATFIHGKIHKEHVPSISTQYNWTGGWFKFSFVPDLLFGYFLKHQFIIAQNAAFTSMMINFTNRNRIDGTIDELRKWNRAFNHTRNVPSKNNKKKENNEKASSKCYSPRHLNIVFFGGTFTTCFCILIAVALPFLSLRTISPKNVM